MSISGWMVLLLSWSMRVVGKRRRRLVGEIYWMDEIIQGYTRQMPALICI